MHASFTRHDFERLPEGFPAQLVEGFLVKQPPVTYGHGYCDARLRAALAVLVGPDRVPGAGVGVLVDAYNVYQPDIVVLGPPPPVTSLYVGVPLLVIEILSRATRERDEHIKTPRLLALGVREVWLVDPRDQRVSLHTRAGARHAVADEVLSSRALSGFAVTPTDLFRAPEGA